MATCVVVNEPERALSTKHAVFPRNFAGFRRPPGEVNSRCQESLCIEGRNQEVEQKESKARKRRLDADEASFRKVEQKVAKNAKLLRCCVLFILY
jgi:hypothetical protein